MSKRRNKHLPTYTHARSSFAGIRERLALASLAFSKTWKVESPRDDSWMFPGDYMHSVRFLSKKEGWESNFIWRDEFDHINLNASGVKRAIALSIEGARAAWFENQHPSKELLAIVANVAAKKAA